MTKAEGWNFLCREDAFKGETVISHFCDAKHLCQETYCQHLLTPMRSRATEHVNYLSSSNCTLRKSNSEKIISRLRKEGNWICVTERKWSFRSDLEDDNQSIGKNTWSLISAGQVIKALMEVRRAASEWLTLIIKKLTKAPQGFRLICTQEIKNHVSYLWAFSWAAGRDVDVNWKREKNDNQSSIFNLLSTKDPLQDRECTGTPHVRPWIIWRGCFTLL